MKAKAKAQGFRAAFPWIDQLFPGENYNFATASVDADILDRVPSFNYPELTKNRITLVSRHGTLMTDVAGVSGIVSALTINFGGFCRQKEELVSEALERLGDAVSDVGFIVVITPRGRHKQTNFTIYHTRENTSIAEVWRRLAAKEEADVRKQIQAEMEPLAA